MNDTEVAEDAWWAPAVSVTAVPTGLAVEVHGVAVGVGPHS